MNQYPGCEICELLPKLPADMILIDSEYWNANLSNQDQSLLGRCYITLKRHAHELDKLTREEELAFIDIRNQLIKAIRDAFQPITFNISCLKNDAFRHDPANTPSEAAHVHWHIIPRYSSQPIYFTDETFVDPTPGRPLTSFERKRLQPATARLIAATIRTNL